MPSRVKPAHLGSTPGSHVGKLLLQNLPAFLRRTQHKVCIPLNVMECEPCSSVCQAGIWLCKNSMEVQQGFLICGSGPAVLHILEFALWCNRSPFFICCQLCSHAFSRKTCALFPIIQQRNRGTVMAEPGCPTHQSPGSNLSANNQIVLPARTQSEGILAELPGSCCHARKGCSRSGVPHGLHIGNPSPIPRSGLCCTKAGCKQSYFCSHLV